MQCFTDFYASNNLAPSGFGTPMFEGTPCKVLNKTPFFQLTLHPKAPKNYFPSPKGLMFFEIMI